MRPVVLIDGAEVSGDAARISVFDRGFLYGESVFEVLRTYDGVAVFAGAHVARLARGCAALGIPSTTEAALMAEVHGAVSSARLAGGEECVVRVIVTGGEGSGLDAPADRRPTRVMTVEPLRLDEARLAGGIDAAIVPRAPLSGGSPLLGAKTGSYLANVIARREARRSGGEEAIFVEDGAAIEGAGSNLFAWVGERLLTAPDEAGVLPGITRGEVVRLAGALGLAVDWRAPRLAEGPSELFVTSSVRGIVPIRALRRGADVVFAGTGFPVAHRLREAFRARAAEVAKTLKSEAKRCENA